MEKTRSKRRLKSSGMGDTLVSDQSPLNLDRNIKLPPITAQVKPNSSLNMSSMCDSSKFQLEGLNPVVDLFHTLPVKSRKVIKKILKENHVSELKLIMERVIDWIKAVCMETVLPAFYRSMSEEASLIEESQESRNRAAEVNRGRSVNTDASCDTEGFHQAAELSSHTAKDIFVCVMHFLHNKRLTVMSDGRFVETLGPCESIMTSLELIQMFGNDLINCVHKQLLADDLGKKLSVSSLSSELLLLDRSDYLFARQSFYMDMLQDFIQFAAQNHLQFFLRFPLTPGLSWIYDFKGFVENRVSPVFRTMKKSERSTVNILSNTVVEVVGDFICEATQNPLRSAEIVRQGKKSGAGSSNVASYCLDELYEIELLGRKTPSPDITSKNEVFTSTAGMEVQSHASDEELELKDLIDESPAPSERSLGLQTECQPQGTPNTASSPRPVEMSMEEIPKVQVFILPYSLIESVVNELTMKLEVSYNVNISGIYLCDTLVDSVVKSLANLAGISVTCGILKKQLFINENDTVLQIVNEAHDILAKKSYLVAAWQDDKMAVSYLTAVLSAVILDYTVVCGTKKSEFSPGASRAGSSVSYEDFKDSNISPCPSSAPRDVTTKANKGRSLLSRIRASLSKVFCFRSKARRQVKPCS